MKSPLLLIILALAALTNVSAAVRTFEFSTLLQDEVPTGFTNLLSGKGEPGNWKIVMDEVPSTFKPLTERANTGKQGVLAQISQQNVDERYPLFLFDQESFGDFTLTTRFKLMGGSMERMAGIAFRVQDPNNYYYVRASGVGSTFRFFKMVDGKLSPPIGVEMQFPTNVWNELKIECKGNNIRTWINGDEKIPMMTDTSFSAGKIGFWTKSDSISYFADTRIEYTPREPLAKILIRELVERYPRLRGVRIYGKAAGASDLQVLASTDESLHGQPATEVEKDVVARGIRYYGKKDKQTCIVTLPLHDRNGDVVAAVRLEMEAFRGQTENNALARALPIMKELEARIRETKDLTL
ncbi:MAG TPA: family 16 glycoside hydrolase [Methylomirabilota bacterium]|nr:family 16 glycoside hydrolase [Methylomirabilota bacterium]